MIFSDSRYASANVYKAYNSKVAANSVVVARRFPRERSAFFYYTWKEGDRIEGVAASVLNEPNLWWRIMDFNPEIANPFSIPIGSVLRIPYE
jgi:hypothetical protein